MGNEVSWRHQATGNTLYYTVRNASRQYWNTDTDGPAFETLTVANWYNAGAANANYWIALTETPASSYFYVGDWPATLTTAGWYFVDIYLRAGANPAISDTLLGTLIVYWNGTTANPWDANAAQINGSTLAAQVLAAEKYSYKDDAVVLTADGADDAARGTNLATAYTAACALTPGGNALSATNRAAALTPLGRYDLGTGDGENHGLLLDTEFVDLIGLGDNPDDVVITSQIATASRGTVEQTADDVLIRGITMDLDAAEAGTFSTKNSAYFPASDLPNVRLINCKTRTSGAGGNGMREGITYSGTYENCTNIGVGGFGGYEGVASGTFTYCTNIGEQGFAGDEGHASGTFSYCINIGDFGFGAVGFANGIFISCINIGEYGFGAGGSDEDGTFIRCIGIGDSNFKDTPVGKCQECMRGPQGSVVLLDNVGPREANTTQIKTVDADTAITARVDASTLAAAWADDGRLDAILDVAKTAAEAAATPGAEMALTDAQVADIVAAVEAEIADDATGEAIKQAIIDKLIDNLPDLDDLSLAAIRNAILDRVLAGNHDTSGSLGKLVQEASTLDAAGIRAAVGLGSANLDTQLGDIPTVAELEARTILAAAYFIVGDYTTPDNEGIANAETAAEGLRTDFTTARAAKLDNLDATVSSRLSTDDFQGVGIVELSIVCQINGTPVDGIAVYLYTDAEYINLAHGPLYTNAFGEVTFHVDSPDNYYCRRQKAGADFPDVTFVWNVETEEYEEES